MSNNSNNNQSANSNNKKDNFKNINPDHLTFGVETAKDVDQELSKEEKERLKKEAEESERIKKLKDNSTFPHLPHDPAYTTVPEDLLTINEFNKNLETSTRIMINVALGSYAVVRKIDDEGNDTNISIKFKRVTYDEYGSYQEIQERIDDYNNRINILRVQQDKTEDTYNRIREYQKELKKIVDEKVIEGLKTFFKSDTNQKAMLADKNQYDYNDLLLSVEIGYFRYTRSPFLRSINSSNNI